MSNVEIYDSSNSQLSSDEYSHDEEDDALMDVAVSKMTPAKSAKSSHTTSTDTTPSKSTSNETTPRKLSTADGEEAAGGSNKPPDSLEHTQRQIKQMQRNSKANLYFKRRSIKWLNQRLNNKPNYLKQLTEILPKYQEHAKRMIEYHNKKRIAEMKQRAQHQRHYERSPSRSRTRTRSGSGSPELICLDDTENEDSPEKPAVTTPPRNARHAALMQQAVAAAFTLHLELEAAGAIPTENGSVLDEFLTLKPVVAAAEPVIEPEKLKEPQPAEQLDLTVLSSYNKVVENIVPMADIEMPLQEQTLKRRRSVTPPPEEELNMDKRSKTVPETKELDDDIIELIPSDMSMAAKQSPPPPLPQQPLIQPLPIAQLPQQEVQVQQQPPPQPPTTPVQKPALSETDLMLKLGSPYSLTPSTGIEFYNEVKETTKDPHVENLAPICFSLETPTPSVEAMEIIYPNEKTPIIQRTSTTESNVVPGVVQQQVVQEPTPFVTPYAPQAPMPQQQQQMQELPLQQMQQVPQQQMMNISQQHLQEVPQPQEQQQQQQPQQPFSPQQQQQQPPPQIQQFPQSQPLPPRSKQRVESTSRQTQTQAPVRSKSSIDLNNSNNSDAVFHQRVKELYVELDEIMTDKVRAVKPELKAFAEEKQRIDSDINTLDKLIGQKEEEYNRLLHLRCVKTELRARLERKERILIMSEILPSILNKNCNTSEIYEMHSLLMQEQNAPMPSRQNVSVMEQLITRVENGLDDIKILRSALGMQEKEPITIALPPPQPHYEGQQHRRNSVPAMRPPPPPSVAADRSAVYGRQGVVRDVRGLIEDFRREHPEEQPLVGKRNKLQPPMPSSSRYHQLINDSKQLTNASMNLAGTSSHRNQPELHRSHPNLLNNHFDNETPLKPLYNSSPLGAAKQHNNESRANTHYNNEMRSVYCADQLQELDPIGRAPHRLSTSNNYNRSKHIGGVTANGPDELDRRCQQCQRYKATYMCAGCKNQWYCSKECQLHAWDTHWETCAA